MNRVGHCGFLGVSAVAPRSTRPTYSYRWLCESMQNRMRVQLIGPDNQTYTGLVNGLRPEDGSGRKWLVSLCLPNNEHKELFVRAD